MRELVPSNSIRHDLAHSAPHALWTICSARSRVVSGCDAQKIASPAALMATPRPPLVEIMRSNMRSRGQPPRSIGLPTERTTLGLDDL